MEKRTGRVGRTSTKELDEKARLAVRAHIRHKATNYDRLLRLSIPHKEARSATYEKIDEVARAWGEKGMSRHLRPHDNNNKVQLQKRVKQLRRIAEQRRQAMAKSRSAALALQQGHHETTPDVPLNAPTGPKAMRQGPVHGLPKEPCWRLSKQKRRLQRQGNSSPASFPVRRDQYIPPHDQYRPATRAVPPRNQPQPLSSSWYCGTCRVGAKFRPDETCNRNHQRLRWCPHYRQEAAY
ncbi:hypothetical protein F5Y16DRAFT_378792 [Xylariaceae sp. FL0255]|nr:hypothetical protein F5Y16DRAFT_378792 [Xylariaceae sp. FL0255]